MPVQTISLFDTVIDSADAPVANATVTLTFGYNSATTADGLLQPSIKTVQTDGTGKFTFAKVIPNDLISPANTVYMIETPFRVYEVAPQSGNGASQQSTAANVIINNPLALAPYTLIGPVSVTGTLAVTGALTVVSNTGIQVDALGNISGRSLSLSSTGPYIPGALASVLGGTMGMAALFPPPRGGGLDDSANMQAVIDNLSAVGGGEAWGWGQYTANVVLKENVLMRGADILLTPGPVGTTWTQVTPFRIKAFATGYVIDTPASAIKSCGIRGIGLQGLGAGTPGGGVRFQNVLRSSIKTATANNFADEGFVSKAACVDCTFEDLFAQNCVLNTTRAAVIGAMDFDGTDHQIRRVEATVSGSGISSASLFCCGVILRGTNMMADMAIGEFSDIGVLVSGNFNRITKSRADLNWGHGWVTTGTDNITGETLALNNGQAADNTYSNFRASAGGLNQFSDCLANDTQAFKCKYGFEDLVSGVTTFNTYSNCQSATAATRQYLTQAAFGAAFSWPSAAMKTLTANSATPDVTGYNSFATNNTVDTTLTNLTGGVSGQRALIFCGDTHTSVQHNGSTFILPNAVTFKMTSGVYYEFFLDGAVWRLIGTQGIHIRQTPTEAVLVSGVDPSLGEIVAVTLTAARVVGIPLGSAFEGQRLVYQLLQSGAGGFAVTWAAGFKVTWSDAGNATGKRSSVAFLYDTTANTWNQEAGQAPYV